MSDLGDAARAALRLKPAEERTSDEDDMLIIRTFCMLAASISMAAPDKDGDRASQGEVIARACRYVEWIERGY